MKLELSWKISERKKNPPRDTKRDEAQRNPKWHGAVYVRDDCRQGECVQWRTTNGEISMDGRTREKVQKPLKA